MGVPLNTTTFFVCQILLFGSIGGLPFASISAIPSLTSSESPSKDDSTSHIILVNNENIIPTSSVSTSSPKNFQLFIGLPLGSENNLLPTDSTENDQTLMADAWTIHLPTSINIQPNVILQNPVSEPTSSLNDVTLDTTSQITSPSTSNSVLTIIPKINIDPVSNGLKRDLRDTLCALSEEQCSSNNNFPSSPFSSFPSLPQLKPSFSCTNMPCARCDSEDSSNLSNSVECDCSLSNPARCSSLFSNLSPTPNTLAFDSSNNINPYFNDLKNYVNSRQSVQCFSNDIQTQPNEEPKISPSNTIRLNNNFMKAKALQNNMFTYQPIVNNDGNCENSINPNIRPEYQNVLRIRNDVLPKMLSENVAVKSTAQYNDDNIRCPQQETFSAQNNIPYIQNNNIANNICNPTSNLNIARMIKDNMNDNNNSNQGCPQLRSIPIYNKESLLNKQALSSSSNYDDCSQNKNNNICLGQVLNNNNNLMKAKALQNNMFTSQPIVNNDGNCENSINTNIRPEYQNVLRIRNDVLPKMLSENVAVKSTAQYNDDNIRCPQQETVSAQNNIPYIQNNNIANNICNPTSNLNIARLIKDNMNDNNNNNQGCPQLRSIPIYNKESLLNKQALSSSSNYDDCSQNQNNNICLGQVINQNNQGCPQLLTIAENNMYQNKNNDPNVNVENSQNCNCENECNLNNNCNCIQMSTPNNNLAQALQMINIEKRTQAPAASINILPIGRTLLDGQPIGNNFISLDTLSCPAQLPTCSCPGSCNSKKLTIQDVSVPISFAPSNPISFCSLEASAPSSTNIMLAPSVNSVNTISPMITNIAPSVPNMAITTSQCPQSFVQPFIFNQDSFCNNNIQSFNSISTPTFIPIQSLPQVQFVNNIPSSTISVLPSLPDNCISPISNLPSVCTSLQPMVTPPYPFITSNLNQADCTPGASAAISPINTVVNSLTKNIMSNLLSKRLPAPPPLAKLPPVNPYNSNLITESTAHILPIYDIPVACNEYVPPMYSSIVHISTFNPNLFCVEPGAYDTCVPFALSLTDAFYPESSFMSAPALTSDSSCLFGSLITPFNLPQASSVVKINNAINMCS